MTTFRSCVCTKLPAELNPGWQFAPFSSDCARACPEHYLLSKNGRIISYDATRA